MNEQDQALEQLEKIIGLTTGRIQWGDIYAKSHYWSGKIHQRRAQEHKAFENYDRFLELWKNADSNISEIEDAQKAILQLREKK